MTIIDSSQESQDETKKSDKHKDMEMKTGETGKKLEPEPEKPKTQTKEKENQKPTNLTGKNHKINNQKKLRHRHQPSQKCNVQQV